MRMRYNLKIALGYLLFCALVFVVIYTFTQTMITNYLIRTEGESLYRTVVGIADDLEEIEISSGQTAAISSGGQTAADSSGDQTTAGETGNQTTAGETGDQTTAGETGDQTTAGETDEQTAVGAISEQSEEDMEIFQKEIQYLSVYTGADCWLVQSDGTVAAFTENYFSHAMESAAEDTEFSDSSAEELEKEAEVSDASAVSVEKSSEEGDLFQLLTENFEDNSYMTGDLDGTLDREALVAAAACTLADGTTGYLILVKPLSKVTAAANSYLNIYFYTTAFIFLISFILIALFTHFMYRPLYKILEGTKAYAVGDFDKKIEIKSNDEIGYLADTLNYMASAISTREEDQRKFISNVSHDFRSPLTSIKGYVEAMLDGTIPPEMQEKYLRIILSETERLQKLTENLLELNRYSEAGMMLDISTFDINQLIREVIPTFEGSCQQKSLRFELKLEGDVLPVSADRSKIAQVLYNLIDNAVKFSNTDSQIVLQTAISNNKVQVSVRDFGIGIPADSISKIWDRFYKTDLSRGKDRRGSGLGLAIIKEIIQAHKEHITVVSTEGAGSEFLFTLPLSRKEITS